MPNIGENYVIYIDNLTILRTDQMALHHLLTTLYCLLLTYA